MALGMMTSCFRDVAGKTCHSILQKTLIENVKNHVDLHLNVLIFIENRENRRILTFVIKISLYKNDVYLAGWKPTSRHPNLGVAGL